MIEHGCPRCNGALFVESFKAEGKTFIDITCLLCSRIWTPGTMSLLLASLRDNGYAEKATRVGKALNAAVTKEGGQRLVV
jgi:hypothetical protein